MSQEPSGKVVIELKSPRRIKQGIKRRFLWKILKNELYRFSLPEFGSTAELSVISATNKSASADLQKIIEMLAQTIPRTPLRELDGRCIETFETVRAGIYPGEHYRLLASLVAIRKASYVVEIGTHQGIGTLALAAGSSDCLVETFDVIPWDEIPGSVLRNSDFSKGRIVQSVADLSVLSEWEVYSEKIRKAEIIFVDGPKDGLFEQKFLGKLLPLMQGSGCLLVMDDIRTLPIIKLWNEIKGDKIDLTSLGHWSGTGLIKL